ncbi:hypothetical protein BCR33DRAFT_716462, partial [Rhizoclosmatium globosum]
MSETIIYQSGTCAAGTAIMAVFASSSVAGTCAPSSCLGAGSVGTSLSCNGSASDAIAQIPGNALVASFCKPRHSPSCTTPPFSLGS